MCWNFSKSCSWMHVWVGGRAVVLFLFLFFVFPFPGVSHNAVTHVSSFVCFHGWEKAPFLTLQDDDDGGGGYHVVVVVAVIITVVL